MTEPDRNEADKVTHRILVYEDTGGYWRWSLTAANNRKIAASAESFDSHRNAMRAAGMMLRLMPMTTRLVDDDRH